MLVMTELNEKAGGRVNGGVARAAKLSPERRQSIAKRAAQARWGEPTLSATHKGNFEKDFGLDVDCFVLNDEKKTAVISQRGMAQTLGLGDGGSRLPRFVSSKSMSGFIGPELMAKLEKPLVFQAVELGLNVDLYGYDVTVLIDICKAVVDAAAAGKIGERQAHIAKQAQVMLNASAKAGIQGLVYALSGYDATKHEVVAAFKLFVREEAREYEKEFPSQLYDEWYRLYQLPRPERNKPWKFKHLTIEQVYHPLARSSGRILELTQAQRDNSNDRNKKLHQFLSDVGVKALRTQLGQLLGIARISRSQEEYEGFVQRLFGDQQDMFKGNST